jgi:hypothetical protein
VQAVESFERALTRQERQRISRLTSPYKIQLFLDDLVYSEEEVYRCPLRAMRDGKAHCFDGALLAAALLRRLGYPPRIVDLLPNDRDDDHLLAVYKVDGCWGALAKSNFAGLRFREPVYRGLRELVMSYFEAYFNVEREKTLRRYTVPLNLKAFDQLNWMVSDDRLDDIAGRLDKIRKAPVLTRKQIARLSPVDERSCRAGLAGANQAGLYRPPRAKKT